MKKVLYFTTILFLFGACISLPYGKERLMQAQNDMILYRWKVPGSYKIQRLEKPMVIHIDGKNVGKIQELDIILWFIPEEAEKIMLWGYSDYSNLIALAQSTDEATLRLYHFHGLIFNNFYVTEFSMLSHKKRTYKIDKRDLDWLLRANKQ